MKILKALKRTSARTKDLRIQKKIAVRIKTQMVLKRTAVRIKNLRIQKKTAVRIKTQMVLKRTAVKMRIPKTLRYLTAAADNILNLN